jgi:Fic family protein
MELVDYKSGAFEQQLEYRSFVPSTIHHEWIIADPDVQQLLSQADRSLGALSAFSQLIPDIDFFIRMYVAKEATESSRIEGTQTNVEDAFKQADDLDPEQRDDWAEVQNYIEAVNHATARLTDLPLSNRLLRETHAILLRGGRGAQKMPGEFRISQNWIGVSLKNAVFVPPHHDRVPDLMSDLERFLHDQELKVPPLVRIAIAHYQFETIHPFLDGNGRLGRLMISLFLASEGLLSKPALYLSDYFERHKTAYIDHLMAVRQGNHMRDWLVFFLHGVHETAQASAQVFRDILALKGRIEREVLPRFSARRQDNAHQLIRHLYRQPIVDVKAVSDVIGSTVNTASTLINDFVAAGVIVEMTGQRRNRLFIFRDYISLFRT